MRFLVVFCHPDPASYSAALAQKGVDALRAAGHETRLLDLYAEGFDPAMSLEERRTYNTAPEVNAAALASHVEAIDWCDAFAFVFPTWFHGPPAMLKGWLERTWLPGRCFDIPQAKGEAARSRLRRVKRLVVITTSGAPRWWLSLIGNPGRKLFTRGLRLLFAWNCRTTWMQLYSINTATDDDRREFLDRVDRKLRAMRA
ncbi:MAG: NAD(P)H-dependent oxidoreductase [Lacipirellulaceae bacterium]